MKLLKPLRRKLIPWLLLVIPTVVMAGTAVVLLHHEQRRLRLTSLDAVRSHARIIVENLDLAVSEVKMSLMDNLERMPSEGLPDALCRWQASSDLVRAAFTCSEFGDIRMPSQGGDASPFDLTPLRREPGFAWNQEPPPVSEVPAWATPFAGSKSARQELKKKAAWGGMMDAWGKAWVYDADGQEFRLAAWLRPTSEADIRALEVSVQSLLEDLRRAFPDRLEGAEAYALIDSAGNVVHRLPYRLPVAEASFTLPVGDELPGWQVAGYHLWGKSWGSQLFWVGSSLVGLLAASIVFSGVMVTRRADQESALAAERTMFVSNVSHELKTPLTAIRMYAEIIRDGKDAKPERRKRYLDVMVSESQRLTRLVNNVLDFSRLDQGKRRFSMASHDVHAVIQETLETQRVAFEKGGFEVDYTASEDPLPAHMDRDAVERILLNLIDNALKYAADGKYLSIGAEPVDDERVRIRVADRGPGVPSKDLERVFTRFCRLDDELTSQSGTGLGLSLARMLAEGMGGSLRCLSATGGPGASFELLLRRAEHGQ